MRHFRVSLMLLVALCGGCAYSVETLTPQGVIAPQPVQEDISSSQAQHSEQNALTKTVN
jgi:hypothetical protein